MRIRDGGFRLDTVILLSNISHNQASSRAHQVDQSHLRSSMGFRDLAYQMRFSSTFSGIGVSFISTTVIASSLACIISAESEFSGKRSVRFLGPSLGILSSYTYLSTAASNRSLPMD